MLKKKAELDSRGEYLWNNGELSIDERQKAYAELRAENAKLMEAVIKRYTQLRAPSDIIEDVKLVVNSIEKKDYLEYVESMIASYFCFKDAGMEEDALRIDKQLNDTGSEDYKGAFNYILSYLDIPLTIFVNKEDYTKKIMDLVGARVSLWYEKPESSYLPVLQGRATNALAIMATRSALIVKDPISHSGKIRVGRNGEEVIGIIKDDKLISKLGVGAHKLLMTAISTFTANNHTGERARQVKATEVLIPLKEYAKKKGYKLDAQPTSTPEEEKKEAQRIKNEFKNARRAIEKDLEVLYNFSFQWKEKIRGKEEDLGERRVIDEYAIERGYIKINIAKSFSEYLIKLPISQYPIALLSLAENQKNAYSIANFMSLHANNDNNIRGGTSNLLKVKTLLSYTNLPSIEDVKKKRKSWTERIKEPLERALDALGDSYEADNKEGKSVERKGCGLLESWEYCHSKGVPLTDKEAKSLIDSFEVWSETLVKFTLKEAPDHRDRLEAKAQRIEEAQTKKTSKKNKSN